MKSWPAACKPLADLESAGQIKEPARKVAAAPISEKDFQAVVMKFAREHGWLCYHTHDSRKAVAGYPDLTLARGNRVIFAELKTEAGSLMADQQTWAEALQAVGGNVEYKLWRPSMMLEIVECLR